MRTTKALALFLAVVMLVGMVPMSVFAGDVSFTNATLSIATEKTSTLAPGITQDSYTLYNNKDEQVKMFVTTADMSVDTVKLFASYKDMDPTNYGMSKLTEQVASFNKKAAAGDEYYQGTVVAGINASYYNMITGKPTGTFVMNGIDVTTESEGNAYGYFAVMKDGSVKIGNKGDYSKDKGNIQEAIGIYTMLIVDGKICSGLNTTQYYPRQTIGITADGKVILMTADGNQAPKSVGLTVLEQAQVMLDLGCVWAGHLDGGGSCTYAAKAEGSSDFGIVNSPSDGSERSISNGFIMVSTAVSDGKFASASLTAENEYVTPGSTVAISAIGVDKAGGPAEIPENAVLSATNGTIVDGKFVSDGTVGEAVVTMSVDGKDVGSTVINVVIPDAIAFGNSEMVVPFGKTVPLSLSATYGVKDVAIKPSDIKLELSDNGIGTISGFEFIAGEEGIASTESTLTATVVFDESVTASTTVKLGKGSEVVYNFEDGTNQNVIIDEPVGTQYNYVWPETDQFIATPENGKVHSGSYAIGSHLNYGNSLESGYMKSSIYATETKVFENAVGVGAWIYISDEWDGLWARWTLQPATIAADGTPSFSGSVNSNTMDGTVGGTGYSSTFLEPGWHYLYADTSAYSAVGWKAGNAMIQLYISDRDGSAFGYTASEYSNIPGKFTIYVDDITVDYSTAVDDREAPKFSAITYATEGMPDAAVLNGQTVSTNNVTFAASVAEDMTKSNYTGIDPATVKAYIDGVEAKATYSGGIVSIENAALTNGKHTVKFSACDNMGNYSCTYGYITVNAAESGSTLKLVPHDASLNYILLGSVYYMDLVADAIEEVEKVAVTIDLDNNSSWQLDHMELADGFSATYTVDTDENVATVLIERTGDNSDSGEAALVSFPVRTWELKTGYTYAEGTKKGQPAYTYAQYKASLKEFWRMSVIATVDCGILTRVDGSVDTFTGERVFCDTEMWANYGNMTATEAGKTYYNNWDGGHLHTAEALEDKAAGCTEDGYTGRTYCDVCASVVEWGTTLKATGHSYEFIEGVLECACGTKFNGIYTDGKTYVDGLVVTNGWNGDSYYLDGVKLTGLKEIDGYYYDFGENGVCEGKVRADGYYLVDGSYMYIMGGIAAKGDIAINLEMHFFDENGFAYSGERDVLGYKCTFDEKGVFVSAEDASVVEAGLIGTNLQYVLLTNGTMIIDGDGPMRDYTVSGDYGPWFYENMAKVSTVKIGAGVTRIGEYAFNRSEHIKSVIIEEGSKLESIGIYAFRACHRLNNINIPASVEKIDNYAFFKCGGLVTITFEENSNLKYIGREAFAETHYLKQITIPASVVTIGDRLFIRSKATVVMKVVEDSIAHVYAVNNFINYELVDGVVPAMYSGNCTDTVTWALYPSGTLRIDGIGAIPDYASQVNQPWAAYRHLVKKISIGKDITAIGNYAFAYCENNAEITFDEGSALEKIGVLAFRSNRKVTEVTLPDSVNYLNTYAFGTCNELTAVYVPQGMGFMHAKAFVESTNVNLNVAKGTYAEQWAVANGVSYTVRDFVYDAIASGTCGDNATWAFYENGELVIGGSGAIYDYASQKEQPWASVRHLVKKITIGKDITVIGNYAFAYCEYNEEIVFEEGSVLEKIGVLSFRTHRKLTKVTLPETVTFLNAYAFGTSPALTELYIPQGMSFMHAKAVIESTSIVLNVAEGTYAEKWATDNGVAHTVRGFVYVPVASGNCGANAAWAFYENGELVISGSGAMENYTSHTEQPWSAYRHLVKKITIGKDITEIGNYAFAYCEYNEEIVFEEGSALTKIGVLSFRSNRKLTKVTLPETVYYLNAYAFGTCTGLTELYIPAGVTFMHAKAVIESASVVLNVADGSYAESWAVANGVAHTAR